MLLLQPMESRGSAGLLPKGVKELEPWQALALPDVYLIVPSFNEHVNHLLHPHIEQQ